jgi:DNA-binding transcriptional LysR family regulator
MADRPSAERAVHRSVAQTGGEPSRIIGRRRTRLVEDGELVSLESGTLYKWEFQEDGREFEVAPSPVSIVNDSALMVRTVQSGIGLAQVLTESVKGELESGRLVRVLKKYSAPFRGFYLYYPSRAQIPLKLKVFVDFLRARFNR